jgi:hypothetical protein
MESHSTLRLRHHLRCFPRPECYSSRPQETGTREYENLLQGWRARGCSYIRRDHVIEKNICRRITARIETCTLFNLDYYDNLWTPFEALSPMNRPLCPCALIQTTHVSQTISHAPHQFYGKDAGQAICTYTVVQKPGGQKTANERPASKLFIALADFSRPTKEPARSSRMGSKRKIETLRIQRDTSPP